MTAIDTARGDLAEVRAEVDATLDGFLAEKARTAPDPCLPPLVDVLRAFTSGGERLRPLFCHCGFLAAGGSPGDPAVKWAGAALEMFHTFVLVHDDIMDSSALRRGRPTVHRVLADRFGGPRGNGRAARRFGVNMAILLGDLCFSWSDELLDRAEVDPARWREVRALVQTMRTELIAGQYLGLGGDGRPAADPLRSAWRVVRLKTARYTVELPLRVGAALAGGDATLMRACGAYGRPVGEAFQLRHDLLSMFGDPGATGEPDLDHLRGGRSTVLTALACQQATPRQREVITSLHGDPDLDRERARLLRDAVLATGAAARVERLIAVRADRAASALRSATMDPAAKPPLAELVTRVTRRAR